jgi:hypothetical protein
VHGGGQIGKRFFPSTLAVDDPFAAHLPGRSPARHRPAALPRGRREVTAPGTRVGLGFRAVLA